MTNEYDQQQDKTRQWYEEHGMMLEYQINYVCKKCHYCASCGYGQLNNEARLNCTKFKEKREHTLSCMEERHTYSVILDRISSRTTQRRLRDGE